MNNFLIVLWLALFLAWGCASVWDTRTARAEDRLDTVIAQSTADGIVTPEESESITRAVLDVREAAQVAYQDALEAGLAGLGGGGLLGGLALRLLQRTGVPGLMRPRKVIVQESKDARKKAS